MEAFTKLFGTWLVFVYHCFDRMVIGQGQGQGQGQTGRFLTFFAALVQILR